MVQPGGPLQNFLIFLAPGAPAGKGGIRSRRTQKDTPRNPTERCGTPKFSLPALESATFWRIPPEFPNIFGAGIPSPTPNWERRGGNTRLPNKKQNAYIWMPRAGIRHIIAGSSGIP